MPFTLSHPAAVLLFARARLPFSALVIGSMAPDFPYFVEPTKFNPYGHTLSGVFLMCLPVGLGVMWLYHAVLEDPLISLFPLPHRERLAGIVNHAPIRSFGQLGPAVLTLLIGAATHIVWDSFTHANGWGVQHFAALRYPVMETAHGAIPIYKALQHGSTVIGAAALIVAYRNWFCRAPRTAIVSPTALSERGRVTLIALMVMGAALFCVLFAFLSPAVRALPGGERLPAPVVTATGALFAELVGFSVLWRMAARGVRRPDTIMPTLIKGWKETPTNDDD